MEGLPWMSLIAFPSETKSGLEWSGSENRILFSWCCKFCCFPFCCSLSWGQTYKARENLGMRSKCEGWLVVQQPSVNVQVTHLLWLHRHIWKCNWIEQCLNDGWEKGGNKTFSPVWCFRGLLLSEECCACLVSEGVLHPHHHPYSLGYGDARKMGGRKRAPWEYSQQMHTRWRNHNSGLCSRAALRYVDSFLYNLWVKWKWYFYADQITQLKLLCVYTLPSLFSLSVEGGKKPFYVQCRNTCLVVLRQESWESFMF